MVCRYQQICRSTAVRPGVYPDAADFKSRSGLPYLLVLFHLHVSHRWAAAPSGRSAHNTPVVSVWRQQQQLLRLKNILAATSADRRPRRPALKKRTGPLR
jgi:hypothetical protein